jgi:outer membrane protein
MKKILVKTLVIMSVATCNSIAQTIEESLAIAYESNNMLKSKREELKAVDENIMAAFSNFLPTLGIARNVQDQEIKGYNPNPYSSTSTQKITQQSTLGTNSLQLRQNVFNSGGDMAGLLKAKRQIEQQRATLIYYEQEVLLNTVKVYLGVAQAQMQLDIYEKKVVTLKKYLEAEEARYKAGEKTKTDVAQARSYFSNAVAARIKAFGDLNSAKSNFFSVVGVEPQNISLPKGGVSIPQNLDDAIAIAAKKNPSLLASDYKHKAADANIHVQRASLLPSATLGYSWQDYSNFNNGSSSNATTLTLNVPLFASANWSQLRAAKRTAQQLKYELLNNKQSVVDQAVVAWQNYETSRAAINAQEDAVESALVAYNGMKEEEKAGTRSTVDVIVAQNNYFDTDINLVAAKTNDIQNRYALKSAVGELTAKDLNLKVPLYDPLKNYNKIRWELIGSF